MEENIILEPAETVEPAAPEVVAAPEADGLFAEPAANPEKKPTHTASLVLGILSIVFGMLIPLAAYILGGIGLSLAGKNKETHSTKAAKVCCIIGIVIGAIGHISNIIYIL